jgi:hypothetical protein
MILMLLAASAAHADLRYVARLEVRSLPSAETLAGMARMAAIMMLNQLPRGEAITFINDTGARVEIRESGGAMARVGTVMLARDAAMLVLDAANRTYWTLPAPPPVLFTPGLEPDVRYTRTGDFATVAGVRTERVTFTMSAALPFTPPPGFPTRIATEGELWVTDRFKSYGAVMTRTLRALGTLLAGAPEGMVVRHITRSAQFGYEVEYTVSDLLETPLSADLFEIPESFRKVPTPLTIPLAALPPAQ